MYGWTHIVLLTDEDTSSTCWSVSQPVDEVVGHDDNYTLTWLRLGSLAERLAESTTRVASSATRKH